ncbi:hypothetical protein COO60DRAFT_1482804 [Scenedesmus sp. NREL 46B-D3]|nr:hypothetical protein COO60DRAFT_1482804 [Scenedesmus sp. NREL 46B-D3]
MDFLEPYRSLDVAFGLICSSMCTLCIVQVCAMGGVRAAAAAQPCTLLCLLLAWTPWNSSRPQPWYIFMVFAPRPTDHDVAEHCCHLGALHWYALLTVCGRGMRQSAVWCALAAGTSSAAAYQCICFAAAMFACAAIVAHALEVAQCHRSRVVDQSTSPEQESCGKTLQPLPQNCAAVCIHRTLMAAAVQLPCTGMLAIQVQ